MTSSPFNKKRWLHKHLDQILALKEQGLTLQAIIERLIKTEKMPFALTESLLSRYLKEFSNNQSSTRKRALLHCCSEMKKIKSLKISNRQTSKFQKNISHLKNRTESHRINFKN